MDAKVKEFLDTAKVKEREAFEKKRDELLISLGLIDDEKSTREYSDQFTYGFNKWDKEAKKYYRETLVAITVTDEEYEEIKKYSNSTKSVAEEVTPTKNVVQDVTPAKSIVEDVKLENGAEKFLSAINGISLTMGIISAVVLIIVGLDTYGDGWYFFLVSIVVLLMSLISWAIVKVILNISNNLHKINSKLK